MATKPVEIEILMKDRLSSGLDKAGRKVKDAESQARQLVAVLEEVRAGYQRLLEANRQTGQSYAQEQANIQALTAQIDGLKEGLKELEAAKQQSGDTPLVDADSVARKTSNLRMQFQQVARELPSLAMGPQMFILAVSNNLPMLADAIADVRRQNELLAASGQKSVPVWKQLAGALLSWQTALMAGISLLIVYGKDIAEWVGNLFRGKEQLDKSKESAKAFNEAMLEGGKSAQQEVTNLNILYRATQDVTKGMNERLAAVGQLQKQYPSYFGNMSQEDILAGKAADSYTRLAASIVASARAQAARAKIVEQQSSVLENEQKINEAYIRRDRAQTDLDRATQMYEENWRGVNPEAAQMLALQKRNAQERLDAIDEEIAGYRSAIYQANKLSSDLERGINIQDLIFKPSEDGSSGDKGSKQIEALKSYLDELTQLRRDNEDRQVDLMADGTDKQLAEIGLRYSRIRDKVRELEADLTKEQGGKLTPEQLSLFGEAYNQIDRQQARDRAGVAVEDGTAQRLDAEREAMNRYLKDYGIFQERRKAIEDEYAQKMAAATTEGDRLSLQKQMEEALSGLELEKLKKSMNWELIFGDLSKVSRKELDKVKDQLDEFRASSEYQNMAVDQKKVVDEALANVKSAMIENGGLLGDLPNQLSELREAQYELTAAQDEYNRAVREGTKSEQENALGKRNSAQNRLAVAERNVSTASDKAIRNITTLGQTIAELGSASEMSLSDMGNMVENVASLFGEMGSKVGGIIGAAMSLIGTIQEQGLSNFLENMGKMGNDLARETSEFFTFGLIDFGGDSDENLESDIERLTASNQELENAINNLSDKMDEAPVAEAGNIYEQQRKNLLEQERNTLEMMQRSAGAYSNGFLGMGGTHSSGHKIDEGMSAADWQAISDVVGRTIKNSGDFFNLTSEEMWRVANEATTVYAKVKDLADNGYRNAAQFMDEYIGYWQELEELQEAYNEKLTSTSFDSIKDDFRNALLDMEDSTEAFADNFEKMMKQAILESMMTETYDEQLKAWYEQFALAMEKDLTTGEKHRGFLGFGKETFYEEGPGLSEEEQEMLRQQWQDIVDAASEEWKQWSDLMGWDTSKGGTSQTGKAGSFNAMSQEQGTKLEGLFTSGQMHWASIDEQMQDVSEQMGTAVDHLRRIEENTGNSARHLDEIKNDIKKIIRDGLKMK